MGSCSDQDIRRKYAGLFVHFAGQRQCQFTNVCRDAVRSNRTTDAGNVQLLAAGRQLGGLGFRLIDRCPGELLQRGRWNGWRVAGVLRYVVNIGKADSRRACQ